MAQTPKPQNPQINRAHPLARGLVAAWPMWEGGGGTSRDVSGSGLDGTITSAPWGVSAYGPSIEFDGTGNQYVTVSDNDSLDISQSVTVECWFKPDAVSNTAGFVTKDQAYMLYLEYGSPHRLQFYVYVAGAWRATASTYVPPLGEWCHAVGVYDGANISIYANGRLVASAARTGAINTNTSPLVFGRYPTITSRALTGAIGGARVWDRALSPSAIRSLFVSPWALYTRPLFGMPNALYTIGGGSSATVGADATAGFPDLLALTSGLLSVPPLAATAGYKSVMSMCGVYIDSAGLPLPSGGGGGKGVRRRRIPMVLFDDAEDGIVINAALDSFGAI